MGIDANGLQMFHVQVMLIVLIILIIVIILAINKLIISSLQNQPINNSNNFQMNNQMVNPVNQNFPQQKIIL